MLTCNQNEGYLVKILAATCSKAMDHIIDVGYLLVRTVSGVDYSNNSLFCVVESQFKVNHAALLVKNS